MKQLFRFWNRLWFLNFLHLTRKKKKRKKSLAEILYPQFKALTSMKHFLWIWQFFFVSFFFFIPNSNKSCVYTYLFIFQENANEATINFSWCDLADTSPHCIPAGSGCARWQFRPTDLKSISMSMPKRLLSHPSGVSKQYLLSLGINYHLGVDVEHT